MRTFKTVKPPSLEGIIKSACDILRRDGLNVMQYMEELSWMLFLKFVSVTEDSHRERAAYDGKTFEGIIPEDLQWANWAETSQYPEDSDARRAPRIDGEALYKFLNDSETGLFKQLAALSGTDEKQSVQKIFKALGQTRSKEPSTLSGVIQKINQIDFHSNREVFTLGRIYEDLLRESGKVGGFSGEFYTPRELVRFMVSSLNPQPGERIYDPAMGTGGFLIGAYEYLYELDDSTRARELIKGSIFGIEKNSSTYLLGLMNALLHDIPEPHLENENTLAKHQEFKKRKFDVILANPPFGGKEQTTLSSTGGFTTPTPATEILFLQHFMETLKATGRAAIVAPNGVLFGDGATLRVKQLWLEEFNVHTIVRLPNGVFSPYTDIPTNVIFFDNGAPTQGIWYYELPLPEGYKKFTKTKPLRDDHLEPLRAWWQGKTADSSAWQYDFRGAVMQSKLEAAPHEAAAVEAERQVKQCEARIKTLEAVMKAKDSSADARGAATTALEGLRHDLQSARESQRREASKAQGILDAPYNLDRNHPDRANELQHAAPEDLLESIFARGERVQEIVASLRETLKRGEFVSASAVSREAVPAERHV